jgi:hypothetical protein
MGDNKKDIDGEAGGMLNDEDLQLVAEGLEPGASSAASGSRTRSSRGRSPAASQRNDGEGSAMLRRGIGRVGRPGLIGTMARTAVVAGTATAVSGGVARRQQARAEEAPEAQAWREQQAQPPPPPAAPPPGPPPADLLTQLKELAALKEQGILAQEEFDAQKARILAS